MKATLETYVRWLDTDRNITRTTQIILTLYIIIIIIVRINHIVTRPVAHNASDTLRGEVTGFFDLHSGFSFGSISSVIDAYYE